MTTVDFQLRKSFETWIDTKKRMNGGTRYTVATDLKVYFGESSDWLAFFATCWPRTIDGVMGRREAHGSVLIELQLICCDVLFFFLHWCDMA